MRNSNNRCIHGVVNGRIHGENRTGHDITIMQAVSRKSGYKNRREKLSGSCRYAYVSRQWSTAASLTRNIKMQQKLGCLKVKDISEANRMTLEILRLKPIIRFPNPRSVCDVKLISLSDASHGGGNEIYGRTGIICGMLAEDMGGEEHVFHVLTWSSHKQRRVSYSSFGSEILAAADADDRGYDLKLSYDAIFTRNKMRHEIFVDSRGLLDTITTVHEPREYRLKRRSLKYGLLSNPES